MEQSVVELLWRYYMTADDFFDTVYIRICGEVLSPWGPRNERFEGSITTDDESSKMPETMSLGETSPEE
jgi:hypothetical protein